MTFNSLSSSATGKHRTTNKRFDLAIISQAGINKLIKQTQRPHLIRQQAAFFFIMGESSVGTIPAWRPTEVENSRSLHHILIVIWMFELLDISVQGIPRRRFLSPYTPVIFKSFYSCL
ncbi:uncharacterized protein LOC144365436 isoform X1 [Ictidomys tridecemlineatus]